MCLTIGQHERADLPLVENVLLWSMRAWVIGLRRRISVEERIEGAFAKLGAPGAASQIYSFIWTVGHCASRMIEFGCVCNRRITADEQFLITILTLTQHGRHAEALNLLRLLLTADVAVGAINCAQRLTACLASAGQILAPRRPLITDFGGISAGAMPGDCRTVTLH